MVPTIQALNKHLRSFKEKNRLGLCVFICTLHLGLSNARQHCSDVPPTKVRWDAGFQRCIPDVCNGVNLLTIPDASGHVPATLACKMNLLDSGEARKCLTGKYMVMLGDSTMTETMHDLVLLLSGLAADHEAMQAYMANATRQGAVPHSQIWVPIKGQLSTGGLRVDFHPNHRNMTITSETLNLQVRHRFIGHVDLGADHLGIETISHPRLQEELDCLLGDSQDFCNTRQPDILVVNSGLHDATTSVQHFIQHLERASDFLSHIARNGPKVIWKGTNMTPFSQGMDAVVRHHIQGGGLFFLDTHSIMEYFAEDIAAGCCSDHQGKGFHYGAIAHYTNSSVRVTVSSMVTQALLGLICHSDHPATVTADEDHNVRTDHVYTMS